MKKIERSSRGEGEGIWWEVVWAAKVFIQWAWFTKARLLKLAATKQWPTMEAEAEWVAAEVAHHFRFDERGEKEVLICTSEHSIQEEEWSQ